MGFTSLSPLELLVIGLLAAGMAYAMYKCGRFGRKKARRSAAKRRARNLEQWIAPTQRANELPMAERFHSNPCCRLLAGRSQLTMEEARASSSSGSNSTLSTTSRCCSGCICSSARVHGANNDDYSNRKRTAQFQTYRENFSQNVSELLTKAGEQQQSLVSDLREVRENLDVVRKEPAEVEQSAQRAEVDGQEEEQQQEKVEQQDEARERQEEEEVEELEEQLDQQDRHNDMMPHADVQENPQMYQEERDENGYEVQNPDDLIENITVLNAEINRVREEIRAKSQENMEMQRCLYPLCQACRQLIGKVLEVAAGSEDSDLDELMDILDVPDGVLPIDAALEIIVNVLRRQLH